MVVCIYSENKKLAHVVSGLIQVSNISKRSVSLSERSFAIAGYLLFIDLDVWVGDIQTLGWSWVWIDTTCKQE